MYCVIKCVKSPRVLKGKFASSVFQSCKEKTPKTRILVSGPQCVNKYLCWTAIWFILLFYIIKQSGKVSITSQCDVNYSYASNLGPWNSDTSPLTQFSFCFGLQWKLHEIYVSWSRLELIQISIQSTSYVKLKPNCLKHVCQTYIWINIYCIHIPPNMRT
jgi:hypothetical protein